MAICPHCSARNSERNQFCGSCGKTMAALPVEKPASERPSETPPVSSSEPTPVSKAPSVARGFRRRRVLRMAVALALGAVVAFCVGIGLPLLKSMIGPQETGVREVEPVASDWHRTRLAHPPPLGERVLRAKVAQVVNQPERYQDRLVRIDGEIVGLREGDPDMLVSIGEDEQVLNGLYPAIRTDLTVGQTVSVVGFVSPEGTEIIVLALSSQVHEKEDDLITLAWHTLLVAGGFFLATAFVRLRGGIDRSRRRVSSAGVVGVALLALMLSGCDVSITTTVSQDGSGSVVTEIEMEQEQVDEILGLPNAEASIDSWIAEFEQQGVTVAQSDSTLRMTRVFDSCSDFNSTPFGSGESWSYLQAIEMSDGTHYVFAGLLDTSSLEPQQGVYDEDGRVYEELDSRTRDAAFTSSVVLPGTALGARGGTPEWRVDMGESKQLFAESVIGSSARSEVIAPRLIEAWAVGLDWGTAMTAGVFVFGLLAYPWRARRQE